MHITIIIDKSTFQLLNYPELVRLSKYFKHNITPLLTMEILGDLKKETKDGKLPADARVKDFAQKLFPTDTVLNSHFRYLIQNDLLGDKVMMDGRPILKIQKTVTSSSGQRGYILETTDEEKSIYKWKEGNFTDADHELSALWRAITTQEDILIKLKDGLPKNEHLKIQNFQELDEFVTSALEMPEIQQSLLVGTLEKFQIDAKTSVEIFGRWAQSGCKALSEFAPYAAYCLRVDLLFIFGLAHNLITTRPTNHVDLEYLYYLPFCNVFTSNDKLHKNLVPLLISSEQRFIIGEDLKKDLKGLLAHIDNLQQEEQKQFGNKPPILEDSIVFNLWREYYGYPQKSRLNENLSEAEMQMLKQKLDEFEAATRMNGQPVDLGDNAEFIVRTSYLGKNDPCYCGSGKKVTDCCIPEEKFNQITSDQMKKTH